MSVHDDLGIDFWWDVRRLWAAELPIRELHVAELEWLLDIPFWTVDGRTDVRPREVAKRPELFATEHARTMRSDLSCPINVIWLRGRWVIMDGLHRLLKAHLLDEATIMAKLAYESDLPLFSRAEHEPHNHP